MRKEYCRSLKEMTASEWLLCLLLSLIAGLLALVSRDDERNPHLSQIFAGQSLYFAFRVLVPVCASRRKTPADEAEDAASEE